MKTRSKKAKAQTTKRDMPRELPMPEFGNALNAIYPETTHENWRQLREWKMFVAGYNAAINAANASIKAKYNMGLITERLFGPNRNS